MKFLPVTVLALVAVVSARNVNLESVIDLEKNTAYGYLSKVSALLAERIRKAEEEGDQNPSRIYGGEPSVLGQFPYHVGLSPRFNPESSIDRSVCSGALLNSRRVVTAAHCWFDGTNQAFRFTVIFGTTRFWQDGIRLDSYDVVIHGNWSPYNMRNDIAMVNLPSAVTFSNHISPIALPSGSELNNQFVGFSATVSGFGLVLPWYPSILNTYLNHVTMPVITNTMCRQADVVFEMTIQSSNICTRGAGGKGTCGLGDSGGPLVVYSNGRPILIGLSSRQAPGGCGNGYPSVFTRVTSYISWINQRL